MTERDKPLMDKRSFTVALCVAAGLIIGGSVVGGFIALGHVLGWFS